MACPTARSGARPVAPVLGPAYERLVCASHELLGSPDPCDFLPFELDDFLRFFADAYPDAPQKFQLGESLPR